MWVSKLKFPSDKTLIGSKASKYSIDLFGFPLSFTYEKEWIIVHITGTIFGKENNKRNFLKDLKKENRVINFEVNDDFFIGTIKEPLFAKAVYNKDIIHVAPALISSKGYEIITIGAFNRKVLVNVARIIEDEYKGHMDSIEDKKIKSISIVKIKPELTKKQKEAIELAIKNGYYHSPRKIDVKRLAKLSELSFSTYQVHLRKAEEKLIPYFFE
ncbi:MAG: helix-turn-helix domain-containing protein [Nanoarchaeota archaeon]